MVQVEHTSLLDRHQYSNIALDFRHSDSAGQKATLLHSRTSRPEIRTHAIRQSISHQRDSALDTFSYAKWRKLYPLPVIPYRDKDHENSVSWHATSYFDFTVSWDLLLSTVCGLHFFSHLQYAHSQHSNFSHNKVQKSVTQRESRKEQHKKTQLELFQDRNRAQMLLIPASLAPTVSNTKFQVHFSHLCCAHVCKLFSRIHGEYWMHIL